MEIFGFIPARANSKGIPGKNIKLLNGKPLIGYTIEEGKKSHINRLIVSTDSPEISKNSQAFGAEVPFLRPAKLSQDDSVIEDSLVDALEKLKESEGYQPDIIVLLQPTSPLRTAGHINDCIALLEEDKADSIVSVSEPLEHPAEMVYWDDTGKMCFLSEIFFQEKKFQRQQYPSFLFVNGAIYAFRYQSFIEKKSRFGNKTSPYVMRQIDSIDIDSKGDFTIAEALLRARNI
jgi:CMP-N,N'-diacetyllegionaminic acid synthase